MAACPHHGPRTRHPLVAATLLVVAMAATAAQAQVAPGPTAIVHAWMTTQPAGGVVAALVDPAGTRFYARGQYSEKDSRLLDPDTVFEAGSISKGFVGLLLAAELTSSRVQLTTRIGDIARPGLVPPGSPAADLTLAALATHTSGLPRIPSNLVTLRSLLSLDNPYVRYSRADLASFLRTWPAPKSPPLYEYSNLGFGLLGTVLAEHRNTDLGWLLADEVFLPLGMTSTALSPGPDIVGRLAQPHRNRGRVPHWEFDALAGAGAVLTTTRDLAAFLTVAAGLRPAPPSLASPLSLASTPRTLAGSEDLQVGLGWHIRIDPANGPFVWHNGATGGSSAFIGWNPSRQIAVAVLSNSDRSIDPLAADLYRWLLLNARPPPPAEDPP